MLFIILAGLFVLVAVAAFVHTVVRTAARQIIDNGRKGRAEADAYWTTVDPDQPIKAWPTYTDPRAVDLDAVPVDEPLTGATAQAMRDALRTDPAKVGRSYHEINTATGGRSWEELKRRAY